MTQGVDGRLLAAESREGDQAGLGQGLAHLGDDLQAGLLRHREVGQQEVRAQRQGRVDGLRAVGGLADDLDPRNAFEDASQLAADGRGVIREHDPHDAGEGRHPRRSAGRIVAGLAGRDRGRIMPRPRLAGAAGGRLVQPCGDLLRRGRRLHERVVDASRVAPLMGVHRARDGLHHRIAGECDLRRQAGVRGLLLRAQPQQQPPVGERREPHLGRDRGPVGAQDRHREPRGARSRACRHTVKAPLERLTQVRRREIGRLRAHPGCGRSPEHIRRAAARRQHATVLSDQEARVGRGVQHDLEAVRVVSAHA